MNVFYIDDYFNIYYEEVTRETDSYYFFKSGKRKMKSNCHETKQKLFKSVMDRIFGYNWHLLKIKNVGDIINDYVENYPEEFI